MDQSILNRYLQQNPDIRNDLEKGKIVEIMGKYWACCADCNSVVRVDKPFIGSLHVCG